MENEPVKKDLYIKPGYICVSSEPMNLFTVVGSGIVITIYDTRLKYGGMNYYYRPIRKSPEQSTPVYACPAIIGLLNMFFSNGSEVDDLEAHVYGGAANPKSEGYIDGLAEKNVQVGFEILEKKNIRITGKDIGGDRGRKVVFSAATGESLIAKVDRIRSKDWYPTVNNSDDNNQAFDYDD